MELRNVLAAAGAVILSSAPLHAADVAKKPLAAIDYVRVCDTYGTGYLVMPGTDTCLRIGGYVRGENRIGTSNWGRTTATGIRSGWATAQGWDANTRNGTWTRSRASMALESRTKTDLGQLRTFVEVWFTIDTGTTTPQVLIDSGYVQWGGLTAGRAESYFDFFTSYAYNKVLDYYSYQKINLLAYTADLGNGLSASLSVEDPSTGSRFTNGVTTEAGIYFGSRTGQGVWQTVRQPDVVGVLALKQDWGSGQIAVLSHNVAGPVSDVNSFAAMAGIKIKLPALGQGDEMVVQAATSRGGLDYVESNSYQVLSGTTATTNIGTDFIADGVNASQLHLTRASNLILGLRHNFSKQWQGNIGGAVMIVDGYGNRDFHQYDLGANLVWKPAAGFDVSAGFEYRSVAFSKATIADYSSGATRIRNPQGIAGVLRFQRNL